jgi:16S rRNA processing protein RimM
VRGALRIKSFTVTPADIAAYGPVSDESGARVMTLRVTGRAGQAVIAEIDGVTERDGAEALKGMRLYVARTALPPPGEDAYYHGDLLGLAVELAQGGALGRVSAVHDHGALDMIEIERDDGATVLLPFTRAAVPLVDIAGGRLVVDPPPGLLSADGEDAGGEGAS